MSTVSLIERFRDALSACAADLSFLPLVSALQAAMAEEGLDADRIQLPMTRYAGFRHPTLGGVIVTWTKEDQFDGSFVVPHGRMGAGVGETSSPVNTPFALLAQSERPFIRVDLMEQAEELDLPILLTLRDRGYRDYLLMRIPMPGDLVQMVSLASRDRFPEDVEARMAGMLELFGFAVYGVYRTSQAMQVARTYIGPRSGPRVLAGEIRRGSTRRMRAGILFCDIRGFTALSERLPPEEVVELVNELFAIVETHAVASGGEILKFIGDAMLVVFPMEDSDEGAGARAMVTAIRSSLEAIAATEHGVGFGFGATIGEVIQGNLGTPERLDFTVMGSAVNLASRLESLCRPLEASALFCSTMGQHVPGLVPRGAHRLKGISAPVPVFGLPEEAASEGAPGDQPTPT